ncbi:MAG: transcriptional regulator [Anaerolineae bacterium]|nr:transcriptional regulator [Anaerolineae bacterium]
MVENKDKLKERLALRTRIIGLLLRNAREHAGKSKQECAEALGVSPEAITAYEEGRKPISLPEVEVLAYLTGTPVSHFWDGTPTLIEEEDPPPLKEILALRHRIVGALLRQARLERNISQRELAELLDCSERRISAYEYGEQPIPLAELEVLCQYLRLPLEHFLDTQEGRLGEWQRKQEAWHRFNQLPRKVQEFVIQPLNVKYLEVAMRLAEMPAGKLREIAEGLLDITY